VVDWVHGQADPSGRGSRGSVHHSGEGHGRVLWQELREDVREEPFGSGSEALEQAPLSEGRLITWERKRKLQVTLE
jgi:hypothetical protein